MTTPSRKGGQPVRPSRPESACDLMSRARGYGHGVRACAPYAVPLKRFHALRRHDASAGTRLADADVAGLTDVPRTSWAGVGPGPGLALGRGSGSHPRAGDEAGGERR